MRAGVGEHAVMTSYLAGTVVCGCSLALSYGWELTLAGMAVVPVAILVQAVVSKVRARPRLTFSVLHDEILSSFAPPYD